MRHLQFNQDAAKAVKPGHFDRRDDKDNLMSIDGSSPLHRPLPPRNSPNLDSSATGLETKHQQDEFLRRALGSGDDREGGEAT